MKNKIEYKKLKTFIEKVFIKAWASKSDAKLVCDVLLESDLKWIESHWINRLQRYLTDIKKEVILVKNSPKIISNFWAIKVVDAKNCFWQRAWFFWMQEAIKSAKKFWVWIVSVKNSNHFGIAWYYSLLAVKKWMIWFSMTNTAPLVVATNWKKSTLWTNPIAVWVPTNEKYPWLMDLATSIATRWKIEVAAKLNKKINKWLAVDKNWNDCNNPNEILEAINKLKLWWLVSIWEHKWYWLACLVDILSWVLSWSSFLDWVYSNKNSWVWHFFLAIDIKRFMKIEEFKERMWNFIKILKSSNKDNTEVRIHWERSFNEKNKRLIEWIPFEKEYIDLLKEISEEYEIKLSI